MRIKLEEANIDQAVFVLLSRILEATLGQGDQNTARQLAGLQQELLDNTAIGQELKLQSLEIEKAVKQLQDAGKDGSLTREKLLDILVNTPSDAAISTVVSYVRNGMDYTFFELLSAKIEAAAAEEKGSLVELREKLLSLTAQIDKAVQVEMNNARKLLDVILSSANVEQATMEHIEELSDLFVVIVKIELDNARKAGDLGSSSKIQHVVATLKKTSAPPHEVALSY